MPPFGLVKIDPGHPAAADDTDGSVVVADRPGPPHASCARDAITRKARTLSKITVEQEPGLADTLLTAELDETHTAPTFAELGVRDEIVRALNEIGIDRTFAIQELTLPLALAGEDLIGQARTGMGKTFGFGVPLLHRIATTDSGTTPLDGTPRALIIVPTRELCIQVTQDLENASKYLKNQKGPLKVTSIYGGRPYESQIAALREGVDVVVGTPGRLQDLAEQQHLVLGKVGVLVLDEADEMLDLGFLPDIERILNMVPEQRQTMLFSATMPGPIITLARTFLNRPTHIRAEEANATTITERISQFVYRAHALDKSELVARILQAETRGATMIFARTKRTAQKVADDLGERGFAVGAVHGDLNQVQREKALKKFREGKIDVLVATDVAARGIDIDDVTHVVNYQCPEDEKTYVHRIGRTGRAGRTGVAITLVDWDELNRWAAINSALKLEIPEPAETYSRSPHLYAELGIPEGVTGQVRKTKPVRDEDAVVVEREARAPRKRNRKRTVRGRPLEDGVNSASTESTESTGGGTAAGDATGEDGADKPRRRRRRRGRGTGSEAAVATTETSADAAPSSNGTANSTVAESVSTDSDNDVTGSDAEADKPARRRRRRRAGAEDSTEQVDTAGDADTSSVNGSAVVESGTVAAETDAAVADTAAQTDSAATDSAEAPAPKKRVRKRASATKDAADSAATDVPVENGSAATDSDEAPAAPKKRVRKRAAAAKDVPAATDAVVADSPVENGSAATDSDEAPVAPKKRVRTKRTSADADSAAADSSVAAEAQTQGSEPEATEPPARRRRRRKADAEGESVEAATDTAVAASA